MCECAQRHGVVAVVIPLGRGDFPVADGHLLSHYPQQQVLQVTQRAVKVGSRG